MSLKFTAQADQTLLPRGLYPATLASVELREGPNGRYLLWQFTIEGEDGFMLTIGRPSSTKFTSSSKARQFADALLGRHINDDEEIDLESLYGASCYVLINVAKLNGSGVDVNRIENILPFTADGDANADTQL